MSWSPTIYVQFPDEAAARAVAIGLGVEFPADGSIPTGNQHFALAAPITEWLTPPASRGDPGTLRPGYWAMLRLNTGWAGYDAAMAVIARYAVTLAAPCNVFAGG